LFVVFTAAQVWQDNERANREVNREASALRAVVVLAASLSRETEARLRALVRSYIEDTATLEWPMMARHTATLSTTPRALAEALQVTLALAPSSQGQETAQREITTALETALDARRQRIIVSLSQVSLVKWSCLFVQAVCALLAIAVVHSDNRLASTITLGLFATGVAASILLILSHDRPFIGELSIRPDPLLQVMPEEEPSMTQDGYNFFATTDHICFAVGQPNGSCRSYRGSLTKNNWRDPEGPLLASGLAQSL
jgi:hypothetical protein